MRKALVLYLLLAASGVYGQNALEYYRNINKGKAFAIENNFPSAVASYQQAFASYHHPFARDCYNAIELAILANDTITLPYFLTKAITQGIRLEDLEQSGKLNNYLNSDFYQQVQAQEDSLQQIYSTRVNWPLRAEINQMFTDDQKMREQYYNAHLFKRKKIGKAWEALNAQQVERLVQITKAHGFPGERLIGVDRDDMHPKIKTHNYSAGMPIVIFIHHFSQPNPSYDSLLLVEVTKGHLYHEHLATICDFEAALGKHTYETLGYYGLRHQPRKPDTNTLNAQREAIGLLGVEQTKQLNQIKGLTKFWNRLY